VSTCKKENERDRILYIAISLTQIAGARSSSEIKVLFSDTVSLTGILPLLWLSLYQLYAKENPDI